MTRWIPRILIAVALLAYLVLLLRHTCYFFAGPDSSGYGNEAKLIAQGRVRVFVEPLRTFNLDPEPMTTVFTPFGFTNGGRSTLVPTYPAGAPIHMAVAAMIGGWSRAPFVVSPLAAIGCLLLISAIGRELGLPRLDRFFAMLIFAAFPSLLAHAVQPVSDVVGCFWVLAVIYLGLRRFSIAAGAALGIAVWVRPTNLLIALPLAFALQFDWRRLMRAAAGAIPFGIALMWFNKLLFGSALRTGYGGFADVVQLSVAAKCGPAHLWWILRIMTPAIMPLALFVAFDRRVDRWRRAMLVGWFAVFYAFYATYGICEEPDIRFLIPAIPPLILSTMLLLRHFGEGVKFRIIALIVVAAIVAREWSYDFSRWDVLDTVKSESIYPETIRWAESRLPPNAFVVAGLFTGAFYYYAGRLTARWDQIDESRYEALEESSASTLPWFAVTMNGEANGDELARRMPGRWVAVDTYRHVTMWRRE